MQTDLGNGAKCVNSSICKEKKKGFFQDDAKRGKKKWRHVNSTLSKGNNISNHRMP